MQMEDVDMLHVCVDGLCVDADEDRESKRRRLTYGVWMCCMQTQMVVIGVGQ